MRRNLTFWDMVTRAFARALFLILAFSVVVIFTTTRAPHYSTKPHVPGGFAAVSESGHCWSGPAPADMAGKIPSHALVYNGTRWEIVDSHNALEQMFNHVNHGLEIGGFCK